MLRKWQQQQAPDSATPSYDTFAAEAASLAPTRTLATTSELYSVFRALHAQSRWPKLCLAPQYGCMCFTVVNPGETEQEGSRQYLVPISKQGVELSMAELVGLLQAVEGAGVQGGLLVAVVDSDGAFSVSRLFASLQPPQGH